MIRAREKVETTGERKVGVKRGSMSRSRSGRSKSSSSGNVRSRNWSRSSLHWCCCWVEIRAREKVETMGERKVGVKRGSMSRSRSTGSEEMRQIYKSRG